MKRYARIMPAHRLVTLTLGDAVPARWVGDGLPGMITSGSSRSSRARLRPGSQPWGPPVGTLDPRRHYGGVAGPADAVSLQPVQAGAHPALGQAGVARQGGRRRQRPPPSGPAWLPGRRVRTCTRLNCRPPLSAGTGSRLSAQEIASTLIRPRPGCEHRDQWRLWSLSQFVSHSPPSAAVHRRPRSACPGWSRMLADGGERWCAVLESV